MARGKSSRARGGRSPRRAERKRLSHNHHHHHHHHHHHLASSDGNSSQGVLQYFRDCKDYVFGKDWTTMASTLAPQFGVGAAFGAALFVSGVANPATVMAQFTLGDFHMLVAFLTASSLSALIIYVANGAGHAKLSPRSCSDYGWLGRYGGNVVGGVMQGIGMAVSGACPGTVLVQSVMGWGKGWEVMAGGVLGGALFLVLGEKLKVKKGWTGGGSGTKEVKTFQEKLGVSIETMIVLYEVMMGGVVVAASSLAPMGTYWRTAVLGGVLIGGAQACSVLFSRKTLGVSTAYQDVAGHVVGMVNASRPRPGWGSIVFAAGIMAGAKAMSQYVPTTASMSIMAEVTTTAAFVGGILSIFGARLAGGCTSGHGISGCSTLSISSLVTVASMFGGGIAFKTLLA